MDAGHSLEFLGLTRSRVLGAGYASKVNGPGRGPGDGGLGGAATLEKPTMRLLTFCIFLLNPNACLVEPVPRSG